LSNSEYIGFGEEYCLFGSFWLKAPKTGAHKFQISADDYLEVWFNKNAEVPTVDYSDATNKVAYLGANTGFRNYYRYFGNPAHKTESSEI
jgi:hypothetical protein